jgi:hypothetical protein
VCLQILSHRARSGTSASWAPPPGQPRPALTRSARPVLTTLHYLRLLLCTTARPPKPTRSPNGGRGPTDTVDYCMYFPRAQPGMAPATCDHNHAGRLPRHALELPLHRQIDPGPVSSVDVANNPPSIAPSYLPRTTTTLALFSEYSSSHTHCPERPAWLTRPPPPPPPPPPLLPPRRLLVHPSYLSIQSCCTPLTAVLVLHTHSVRAAGSPKSAPVHPVHHVHHVPHAIDYGTH